MRVVLQRVLSAEVKVDHQVIAAIENGLLLLVGIAPDDNEQDINWLCHKICSQRIFPDSDGKMNLSIKDIDGNILVVSQFTLFASTKKGNRPSFTASAHPQIAIPLYQLFIQKLEMTLAKSISSGIFGADMKVQLINDGPVTILLDSKNKE